MRVLQPSSLVEAARLRRQTGGTLIAGGTDLLVGWHRGVPPPEVWIDLSRVDGEARQIHLDDGSLHLGALVTSEQLAGSAQVRSGCASLHQAASQMGSRQIRHRGTLGGNLVQASPAADTAPPLLTAEAVVVLVGPDSSRELPLDRFFLGPGQTALHGDEVVAEVRLPVSPDTWSAFGRVGSRRRHAISQASASLSCRRQHGLLRQVRVALGGVAPTPRRARRVESLLEGRRWSRALIAQASELVVAEADPIDDLRASRAHRLDLCRALLVRLLEASRPTK